MEVGIRELKARLSHYLTRAAGGETVVVTDRGRPVARLVGLGPESAIERGIEEGWVDPPRRSRLESAGRYRSSVAVLDVLDEDRG